MMKLYNTLDKHKQPFKPLNPPRVSLYTCGPTVYDRAHIGNFRTYIFEDILRRTLKLNGYKLTHVMNITDVDDKTIKRSRERYPDDQPLTALKKLTSHYTAAFYEDARKVGIDLGDSQVIKATDEVDEMKKLVKQIPNKYLGDDGAYFKIDQYSDYGIFVKLDRSHAHHRISNDEYDKEHVADFALWKTKNSGEPSWEFELDGRDLSGRPGWHLECSAIATKYLGQPFDIHTGGVDLMFPHHENEVAQSKSANNKDLARYFLHAQHMLVNNQKMSKSLNNFYTVSDLEEKGFDSLAFRLLVLQAHYRSQINFTWQSMEAVQKRLNTYRAMADLKHQLDKRPADSSDSFKNPVGEIKNHLSNDLSSPLALSVFDAFVDVTISRGVSSANSSDFEDFLNQVDSIFSLSLSRRDDITAEQKVIIAEREAARGNNDWSKSDELRVKLAEQGIEINDTERGPIWFRTKI